MIHNMHAAGAGRGAYLHELLKSSTIKGLALVGGRVARHDGLLALGDLVAEEGWCGREGLGGMSRRWGTRYPSSCMERRPPCRLRDAHQSLKPAHVSDSPLRQRGELMARRGKLYMYK
jgi:hypothetical protein